MSRFSQPAEQNAPVDAGRFQERKFKGESPSLLLSIIPMIGATLFLFLAVSLTHRFLLAQADSTDVIVRGVDVVSLPSALETPPPPTPITADEYLRAHGVVIDEPQEAAPVLQEDRSRIGVRLEPLPLDVIRRPALPQVSVEEALRPATSQP